MNASLLESGDALSASPRPGRGHAIYSAIPVKGGPYSNFAIATLLVWILWNVVPARVLLLWLGAMIAVTTVRQLARFVQLRPRRHDHQGSRSLTLCATTSNALIWGIAGYAFAPYCTIEYQIVLALLLAGMAVGAIPRLAALFEVYLLNLVVLLLPMAAWFYSQWTSVQIFMGSVVVVLGASLIGIGHNYHRNLQAAVALARRNDELTDGLCDVNTSLERTNLELNAEIKERREAQRRLINNSRELYESQSRFRDFAQLGADLFWEVNAQSRFTFVSDRFSEVMGLDAGAVLGQPFVEVVSERMVNREDLDQYVAQIENRAPLVDFRFSWRKPDDTVIVLLSNGKPAYDQSGGFRGYRCAAEDITESDELAQRLSYQATHDELTKLINRREFEGRLRAVIGQARCKKTDHAFCYIDLDQFKVVNDTCGHAAGDELLRQLVGLLQSNVRARDTVARLGGDEFGVLLEHCSAEESYRVAEMLRRSLGAFKFSWKEMSFQVSASIGVVPITPDSVDMASVMGHADAACYAAKDAGRNQVHIYEPGNAELEKRHGEMQWVNRITKALEEDRFCLCAQPIWPVNREIRRYSDGKLIPPVEGLHYEILIRMRSEEGSYIGPDAFLPAAERYNLSPRLDRWVISSALGWLSRASSVVGSCSINVSGNSLGDTSFSQFVINEIEHWYIPPSRICFEITETAAIKNLTAATQFIQTVRELGCRLSLDDFGSGLSSFGYLKTLHVDYLKIDGVFVKDIAADPVDYAMVKSINELGHVLGIETIAEFVEDEHVLEKLREIGTDYAQGFHIGKPVILEDICVGSAELSGQ